MQSEPKPLKVLIVAAEASSSLYALRLLENWKSRNVAIEAFGIGSREMEANGFKIIGRAEELAVMGLFEVLSHWTLIKRTFDSLVAQALESKPDVILLMDYPGFNLRFAKKMKLAGFKVVYYISPQLWAWKQGRVKIVQKYVDRMIVLFPFEVDFYKKHNVTAQFLGNPLLDELKKDGRNDLSTASEREKFGIGKNQIVLGLMPGSRNGELAEHLEIQIQTAEILSKSIPNLTVLLMVAPTLEIEQVRSRLPKYDFDLVLIKRDPTQMIPMADFILCTSGTATLMVALMKVPMVIMYRFKPLTVALAKLFVKMPKFFGLPNLILDQLIVPEIFQEEANPQNLAKICYPFLESKSVREEMVQTLSTLWEKLGSRGATERVARSIEEVADRSTR